MRWLTPDTAAAALDLMTRLLAVTLVLGSVEVLLAGRELRPGGLLDWSLTSLVVPPRRLDRLLRRQPLSTLMTAPGATGLAATETLAAALLAVDPRGAWAAVVCLVAHGLLLKRHHLSVEGSDDMIMVLLGVTALRGIDASSSVQTAAAAFVAAQVCLAYLTSGLSKTQSAQWWTGSGLPATTSTLYFGHPTVSRLFWRHPVVARAASWGTIAAETLFVLCLVAPRPVVVVAVLVLGGLHLACAVVMGLSQFVWPFAATYPCVLYVNGLAVDHLDPAARLAIALGGAALIAGAGGYFTGRATAPTRVVTRPVAPHATAPMTAPVTTRTTPRTTAPGPRPAPVQAKTAVLAAPSAQWEMHDA